MKGKIGAAATFREAGGRIQVSNLVACYTVREVIMRGKLFIGSFWLMVFGLSVWLDYLIGSMIHVHFLFIIPVLIAAHKSGRFWGFSLAVAMPVAHGLILTHEASAISLPQLCAGMATHISTLALLAELVHRVTIQKKELLVQKLALAEALDEARHSIKILRGMLPICAGCKSIREDNGYWKRIEDYLQVHSELEFSHGICPDCVEKLYPEFAGVILRRKAAEPGRD
jgi:hypothetical protein